MLVAKFQDKLCSDSIYLHTFSGKAVAVANPANVAQLNAEFAAKVGSYLSDRIYRMRPYKSHLKNGTRAEISLRSNTRRSQ